MDGRAEHAQRRLPFRGHCREMMRTRPAAGLGPKPGGPKTHGLSWGRRRAARRHRKLEDAVSSKTIQSNLYFTDAKVKPREGRELGQGHTAKW